MEITRLSTKGQIVLPLAVRASRAWKPGTEFIVEETSEGVLLRPMGAFPPASLDRVAGCLRYKRKPKALKQMGDSIGREVMGRRGRGQY
jgi:AbrB family looped-hinge helix DNA binding protein